MLKYKAFKNIGSSRTTESTFFNFSLFNATLYKLQTFRLHKLSACDSDLDIWLVTLCQLLDVILTINFETHGIKFK